MSTTGKVLVSFLAVGTIMWLGWTSQPDAKGTIRVSVTTAPFGPSHEKNKIFLKASANGNGVSHGEVNLDLTPANPRDLASSPAQHWSIEGYTDTHGVFVCNWNPRACGQYMVTASVRKPGYVAGKCVCFMNTGPWLLDRTNHGRTANEERPSWAGHPDVSDNRLRYFGEWETADPVPQF